MRFIWLPLVGHYIFELSLPVRLLLISTEFLSVFVSNNSRCMIGKSLLVTLHEAVMGTKFVVSRSVGNEI